MKKNVGGQVVVAQLVSKTDGSAVTTGTTTVYVLGDGATQFLGSPGPATATHEGNGVWSYTPEQSETNYDHVAFTFVNSSAVNVTVQVYPSYPQTGDNFARLGAPAGASVSADIAAVKAETASILTDTAEIGAAGAGLTVLATAANLATVAGYIDTEITDIQSRLPAALVGGRIDASVGAMAANTLTASALATDAVTEIQSGLSTLDAAGVRTAVGLATANLDTQLATIDDFLDTEVAAIKAKTDNLPASPASSAEVAAILTTTMTEAYAADGSTMTLAQALYMIWSLLAERNLSGTTLTAKKLDGSTTSMTFTLDSATVPTTQTRAT